VPKSAVQFKTLKQIKFKNVTIGGSYEWKLEPWTIIYLVGFNLEPTDYCKESMSEHDFKALLARDVLGIMPLEKAAERVVPPPWMWYGMRYSHEHNAKVFNYRVKKAAFQCEFYVLAPDEYHQNQDKKGLEREFKLMATRFANIDNFKSNKFWIITPLTRVK